MTSDNVPDLDLEFDSIYAEARRQLAAMTPDEREAMYLEVESTNIGMNAFDIAEVYYRRGDMRKAHRWWRMAKWHGCAGGTDMRDTFGDEVDDDLTVD